MIKFSEFISIIRDVANEAPDTSTYCRYFHYETQEPICIIGMALAKVAGNEKMVTVFQTWGEKPPVGKFKPELWNLFGIEAPTPAQLRWVDEVQTRQDGRPDCFAPFKELDSPIGGRGVLLGRIGKLPWAQAVSETDSNFFSHGVALVP